MSKYDIEAQPLRTGAMAQFPYSKSLEDQMTFTSAYSETKGDVNMSLRVGGLLYVPRRLAQIGLVDDRVVNPIPAINCTVPPRSEEQGQCIAKSIALLKDGVDHVMEAPTGWGKTYGGSAVAAGLGQTTLIVVPKNDLVGAWRDTLINLVGVPASRIGLIQQDVCDYKDRWFVIAMVHSLVIPGKYDHKPDLLRYFGTVLFDETHKMAADTFQRACQMFYAKYRLGLSATPLRGDGKDPVIRGHIGPVLVKGEEVPMSPRVFVKKTGWKIPRNKRWDSEKQEYFMQVIPHAPGRMALVYRAMVASVPRNNEIAQMVMASYRKGRRIVVMSDTNDHLKKLLLIIAAAGVPGEQIGFYVGGMKDSALKANANRRVVLATYAMTAEGTNFPVWDTLVLATPRAKVKQAIGRVMRWEHGKKEPVVFDLVDDEPIFQSFYKNREVSYYQVKATIVKI